MFSWHLSLENVNIQQGDPSPSQMKSRNLLQTRKTTLLREPNCDRYVSSVSLQEREQALISHKNTLGSEDLLDASPGCARGFLGTCSNYGLAKTHDDGIEEWKSTIPLLREEKRQKGLGDTGILLVPRKTICNTDKNLQVRKLC